MGNTSPTSTQPRYFHWAVALIFVVAIYLPGLGGDFVFDDHNNIVDNETLRPATISAHSLLTAALSSDSGPLKRPLASLSFLANYKLFGSAPFSFKVVNLVIHLINGFLGFLLLRGLFCRVLIPRERASLVAMLVSVLWLIHPINLTAVLYVVQRMTSLSAMFTLMAMICYMRAREWSMAEDPRASTRYLVGAIALGFVGVAAKESAVLLPFYLFVIEITAFGFAKAPRLKLAYVLGAISGAGMLAYLLGPYGYFEKAFVARPFTGPERLLTEMRILVFYLGQILLPHPSANALLHSDWTLSTSLWKPWTTAASAFFLLAALAVSVAMFRVNKIFFFAISWFLAGHLLESTIVPLDLIYEHRNYLPALGILCLPALALERMFTRRPKNGYLVFAGVVLVLGAQTAYRAWQWGDAFTLAFTEARHNPNSGRARHEYASQVYQRYLATRSETALEETRRELLAAIQLGDDDYSSQASLLNTYLVANQPIPGLLLQDLESKLSSRTLTTRRLNGIHLMIRCQMSGYCRADPDPIIRVTGAALANPTIGVRFKVETLEWLAIYYANVLHDYAAARKVLEDAVGSQPDNPEVLLRLLELQLLQNDRRAAASTLERVDGSARKESQFSDPEFFARLNKARMTLRTEPKR